jgi:hypothetical protein
MDSLIKRLTPNTVLRVMVSKWHIFRANCDAVESTLAATYYHIVSEFATHVSPKTFEIQ